MPLFKKNPKNTPDNEVSNASAVPSDENRTVLYKDGVFEVYTDKADGRTYGRILKYHGFEKIVDIPEEEVVLWKDAGENFGKYRITYERDDDFFIEKAHIELASVPTRGLGEQKTPEKAIRIDAEPAAVELSDEEKTYRAGLVRFYNEVVQSEDGGEAALRKASLDEVFCTAALAERKIGEFVAKARKVPGQETGHIDVQIPLLLGKTAENAKKETYARILGAEALYVIDSDVTHFQHSAGGCALIALSEESANGVLGELAAHNQKVSLRKVGKDDIQRELYMVINNGFRSIRFLYQYGGSVNIPINTKELPAQAQFPENIALRACMIAFFQDLRNGVPQEKLKRAEMQMYDTMFKATYLQPCIKNENGSLTLSLIRSSKGNHILDLYSSVELMEQAESYKTFRKDHPDTAGYRRLSFENVLAEIESDKNPVCGYTVDKNNVGFIFVDKALEMIKNAYTLWKNNGNSFLKKPENEPNEQ